MLEMASHGALSECGERLVEMALDRGGHDNVSVVLLEAGAEAGAAKITREVAAPC
jgi:serine/threonine protein phosphatase PrpC